MLAPLRSDEGDTDFAAEPPDHLAFPAAAIFTGHQQMKPIGHLNVIGKQACAVS